MTVAQAQKVAHEQVCFKRLGAIVVLSCALLKAQPVLGAVVPVVADNAHAAAEALAELAHERGLSAAGAAGDANHKCTGSHR